MVLQYMRTCLPCMHCVMASNLQQSINRSISTDVSPILEVILTYLIQAKGQLEDDNIISIDTK